MLKPAKLRQPSNAATVSSGLAAQDGIADLHDLEWLVRARHRAATARLRARHAICVVGS
jgi:hypothetical protein